MSDSARSARSAALAEKKRRLEALKARRNQRTEGDVVAVKTSASANLDEYIDDLLKAPVAVPGKISETDEKDAKASIGEEEKETSEATTAEASDNVIAVGAPALATPPTKKAETVEISTQTDPGDFPDVNQEEEEVTEDQDKPESAQEEKPNGMKGVEAKEIVEPKLLSTEEQEEAVASAPFSNFLNSASKKVERVLGAPVLADLLVNFVGETDGVETVDKTADGTKFLSARESFGLAKWTANRDVTDMDWSPLHRELMLSSYHMPSSAGTRTGSAALRAISPDDTPSASLSPRSGELQADGLVLLWNLAMPSRPEHIFTCGSPALNTKFHPSEAPLLLGGCQSGQLVIWDLRAGRLPVQRSSQGHVHPVCAMEVVETGTGLVSASTDGKISFWSLASLQEPVESLQMDGNISSLAVAPESNTIVCGSESGAMHLIPAPATAPKAGAPRSSKRQVRRMDTDGHFGMVTSVATKGQVKDGGSAGLAKGFLRGPGGMLLSAGVDWTVKLWAPAYKEKPLLNFVSHSYDYLCDVQWNPVHPSLFATASSDGSVGFWNLASSLDEPLGHLPVEKGIGVNKLKWSTDGRRMLVACADQIHVLNISDDIVRQKGDEEDKMMNLLSSRGLLEKNV